MDGNWVSIAGQDDLAEVVQNWAAKGAPGVGVCLVCGKAIASEDDLIPGSNFHNCPEVRRLLEE
jgi:hypothetical protein